MASMTSFGIVAATVTIRASETYSRASEQIEVSVCHFVDQMPHQLVDAVPLAGGKIDANARRQVGTASVEVNGVVGAPGLFTMSSPVHNVDFQVPHAVVLRVSRGLGELTSKESLINQDCAPAKNGVVLWILDVVLRPLSVGQIIPQFFCCIHRSVEIQRREAVFDGAVDQIVYIIRAVMQRQLRSKLFFPVPLVKGAGHELVHVVFCFPGAVRFRVLPEPRHENLSERKSPGLYR